MHNHEHIRCCSCCQKSLSYQRNTKLYNPLQLFIQISSHMPLEYLEITETHKCIPIDDVSASWSSPLHGENPNFLRCEKFFSLDYITRWKFSSHFNRKSMNFLSFLCFPLLIARQRNRNWRLRLQWNWISIEIRWMFETTLIARCANASETAAFPYQPVQS